MEEAIWVVHALATELIRARRVAVAREDLISCGFAALVRAESSFDARPGVKFSTYAYHRIRGAMLDAREEGQGACSRSELRHMRQSAADSSRSQPTIWPRCPPPDVRPDELSGDDAIPERDLITALDSERVHSAVARLPSLEREIVELLYFRHDNSFEAVAREIGVARPVVFRLHARALGRLRKQFSRSGTRLRM